LCLLRPYDPAVERPSYVTGDATAPVADGNKIIAHICNDIGGWGRGFVVAVSRRWPEPEREYRGWYRERADGEFALGAARLVQVEPDVWVANMIGQHGLRSGAAGPPIRYEAVEQCLTTLAGHAERMEASVHMPRIGCGLAGGSWEEIEPIILRTLGSRNVPTTVYDLA
jgi:O-acetyl-ADP-ribose deacetylase (regulator of RNase III)